MDPSRGPIIRRLFFWPVEWRVVITYPPHGPASDPPITFARTGQITQAIRIYVNLIGSFAVIPTTYSDRTTLFTTTSGLPR
jgi:hypothetical protein